MPQWIQKKLPKWIRNRVKEAASKQVNIYQAKVEGVREAVTPPPNQGGFPS
jgi:hypothetical protein